MPDITYASSVTPTQPRYSKHTTEEQPNNTTETFEIHVSQNVRDSMLSQVGYSGHSAHDGTNAGEQ